MTDINKCPFCGGDGELIQRYSQRSGHFIFVKCCLCNAQSKVFSFDFDEDEERQKHVISKAIGAWNTRFSGDK